MNLDREVLELCREVSARTGWLTSEDESDMYFYKEANVDDDYALRYRNECPYYSQDEYYPLYTSDYILSKLLLVVPSIHIHRREDGSISLQWNSLKPMYDDVDSSSTLKSLLKLVIVLSKAGELPNDVDVNNIGFKEIHFTGKAVQPDGSSTSRDYMGIMYVGENEDGTPKENYLDFKDIDFTRKLGNPVPVPKVPEGFVGWVDSYGNELSK